MEPDLSVNDLASIEFGMLEGLVDRGEYSAAISGARTAASKFPSRRQSFMAIECYALEKERRFEELYQRLRAEGTRQLCPYLKTQLANACLRTERYSEFSTAMSGVEEEEVEATWLEAVLRLANVHSKTPVRQAVAAMFVECAIASFPKVLALAAILRRNGDSLLAFETLEQLCKGCDSPWLLYELTFIGSELDKRIESTWAASLPMSQNGDSGPWVQILLEESGSTVHRSTSRKLPEALEQFARATARFVAGTTTELDFPSDDVIFEMAQEDANVFRDLIMLVSTIVDASAVASELERENLVLMDPWWRLALGDSMRSTASAAEVSDKGDQVDRPFE